MTAEELHQLLDACWDARRDPLDDPAVTAWLDAHPEHCEAFARRRAAMFALAESSAAIAPATPVRRRHRRTIAAAAIGALGIGAAYWNDSTTASSTVPMPSIAQNARIVDVTFDTTKVDVSQTFARVDVELESVFDDTTVRITTTRTRPR